jgi:hypothetical protein
LKKLIFLRQYLVWPVTKASKLHSKLGASQSFSRRTTRSCVPLMVARIGHNYDARAAAMQPLVAHMAFGLYRDDGGVQFHPPDAAAAAAGDKESTDDDSDGEDEGRPAEADEAPEADSIVHSMSTKSTGAPGVAAAPSAAAAAAAAASGGAAPDAVENPK